MKRKTTLFAFLIMLLFTFSASKAENLKPIFDTVYTNDKVNVTVGDWQYIHCYNLSKNDFKFIIRFQTLVEGTYQIDINKYDVNDSNVANKLIEVTTKAGDTVIKDVPVIHEWQNGAYYVINFYRLDDVTGFPVEQLTVDGNSLETIVYNIPDSDLMGAWRFTQPNNGIEQDTVKVGVSKFSKKYYEYLNTFKRVDNKFKTTLLVDTGSTSASTIEWKKNHTVEIASNYGSMALVKPIELIGKYYRPNDTITYNEGTMRQVYLDDTTDFLHRKLVTTKKLAEYLQYFAVYRYSSYDSEDSQIKTEKKVLLAESELLPIKSLDPYALADENEKLEEFLESAGPCLDSCDSYKEQISNYKRIVDSLLAIVPDTVKLIDTVVIRDTVTISDTIEVEIHDTITVETTIHDTVYDNIVIIYDEKDGTIVYEKTTSTMINSIVDADKNVNITNIIVEAKLYDVTGSLILNLTDLISDGNGNTMVSLKDVQTAGVYFIVGIDENGRYYVYKVVLV